MFESFLGQWNRFLMSRYSVIREKPGQNHRNDSIFLEKSPSVSEVLKVWSFRMQKKCQETLWAVINCSLRFLILHRTKKEGQKSSFSNNCVFNSITGNTRKTGQNRFFQPERGFFQKISFELICFKKNVLLNCTLNFSKSWGPFAIVYWLLSYLTKWENKR